MLLLQYTKLLEGDKSTAAEPYCAAPPTAAVSHLWWEHLEEQYWCDDHAQQCLRQTTNKPGGPSIRDSSTCSAGAQQKHDSAAQLVALAAELCCLPEVHCTCC